MTALIPKLILEVFLGEAEWQNFGIVHRTKFQGKGGKKTSKMSLP